MIYAEKEIKLKDGTKCILRSSKETDAEDLIDYLRTVSGETNYLVSYPEEINLTVEQEISYINKKNESSNQVMINAFVDGILAGNTDISPIGDRLRMQHRASFGIAIKKEFWGNGIGNALTEEALKCAKEMGFKQVELGVYAENKKAQDLYKKFGFEVWGCTKNAFKFKDGTFHDDLTMGKIL